MSHTAYNHPNRANIVFVEFHVQWNDGVREWHYEQVVWNTNEQLVLDYWHALGGRDAALGLLPGMKFVPARIVEERQVANGEGVEYRVQWVGYEDSPEDTSWEGAEMMEEEFAELVNEWKGVKGEDEED